MGAHSSLIISEEQARKIWNEVVRGNEEASLNEMEAFFDQATDEALYNVCIHRNAPDEDTSPGMVENYVRRYLEQYPSARPDSLTEENRIFRRLLAIRVAGGQLYGDDGELQDCTEFPHIDFRRDSAKEIERKLAERGMRKLATLEGIPL